MPSGAVGQQLTGGFSFGLGGRLNGWLRLPEVSFGIGGGSFDGARLPLEGQRHPLEARATSVFLLRVELALGFEIPLPHVRPYALGRAAGTLYVVDAEVRDARLGRLGSESTSDGRWEVGTEVGLSIALGSRALALNIGWRANWLGSPGHGVSLSLVGGPGVGNE